MHDVQAGWGKRVHGLGQSAHGLMAKNGLYCMAGLQAPRLAGLLAGLAAAPSGAALDDRRMYGSSVQPFVCLDLHELWTARISS